MKVLIIGSGGREHALAWKIYQSHKVKKIYAIPGNPGIAEFAECVNLDIGRKAKNFFALFVDKRRIKVFVINQG